MRLKERIGWKVYAVAVASIILGAVALHKGFVADGLKGLVFGLALASLRDAIGKILHGIEGNRRALSDLRAAIEAALDKAGQHKR